MKPAGKYIPAVYRSRNILIINSRDRAKDLIKAVGRERLSGYWVFGCFGIEEKLMVQKVKNGYKVIGLLSSLEDYIRHNILDEFVTGIISILLILIFLVIGAAIKICSSGPIFYSQERLGLNANFGRLIRSGTTSLLSAALSFLHYIFRSCRLLIFKLRGLDA